MDKSRWRVLTKGVAYVDLSFLLIALIGLAVMLVFAIGGIDIIEFTGIDSKVYKVEPHYVTVWLLPALAAMQIGIEFWTTIKLLNAAEIRKDPKMCLRSTRIWRNVTIAFLVLAILGGIIMGLIEDPVFKWHLLDILWRVVSLVIVCSFIKELEKVVQQEDNYIPINIIVN